MFGASAAKALVPWSGRSGIRGRFFSGRSEMRQRLNITLSPDGAPCAHVPFQCMWNLVEYLSYQRLAVTYTYQETYFTVTFPRMDRDGAQRILDEWAHASMGAELQPA
jgi:hypothetical protein